MFVVGATLRYGNSRCECYWPNYMQYERKHTLHIKGVARKHTAHKRHTFLCGLCQADAIRCFSERKKRLSFKTFSPCAIHLGVCENNTNTQAIRHTHTHTLTSTQHNFSISRNPSFSNPQTGSSVLVEHRFSFSSSSNLLLGINERKPLRKMG